MFVPPSSGDAEPADGPARVLVVEDDPHMRQAIQWILEDEGLPFETASDGREALERAAERRPPD